jgi:hypothetical protein
MTQRERDVARGSAALALFALWSGCAPSAPHGLHPAFTLSGLVTSEPGRSLHEAAALLGSVGEPCWLVAGSNDLSLPNAILDVAVTREAPAESTTPPASKPARQFQVDEPLLPPEIRPDASILVFGGYQRLFATPTMLRAARARFRLVGPNLRVSADAADSRWAASLLPASEREGFEWAILFGTSVAYDPTWRRDVVYPARSFHDERT